MASLRTLVLDRADVQLSPELLAGRLADVAGFRPTVELDLGNIVARWDAEFVRISDAIDAETRTIGVVVAVDDPIALAIPGRRPPLSKGMFVKVAIRGDPLRDRVLVPRHAVRAGSVLLADDDNRLSRRAVEVTFEQQGISVIESGLDGGERVLVTDVVPRVEGMRLEPVIDEDETMRLRDAAGEAP
jgi:multidrug efflux pump subunit AcrA (membrane-fusion protein)